MGRSRRYRFLFGFLAIIILPDSRIHLSRVTLEEDGVVVFLVVDFLNLWGFLNNWGGCASGDDYNQTENTEDQTNYYCVSDFRMVIVSVHERTPSTGTIATNACRNRVDIFNVIYIE